MNVHIIINNRGVNIVDYVNIHIGLLASLFGDPDRNCFTIGAGNPFMFELFCDLIGMLSSYLEFIL